MGVGLTGSGSSGASYGGGGGQGQGQTKVGKVHGSYLTPQGFGKNGGQSTFPHLGGVGGGRLYMKVDHTLNIEGTISGKGGAWRSVQAGGGSGGSIYVQANWISGDGLLDVSGGAGYAGGHAPHGGGGGGGRGALYYCHNHFVGRVYYDISF